MFKRFVLAPTVTAFAALGAAPAVFAADADALTAITGLDVDGYGPALFGIAATAVAVMVGVKWIKRARGAA